MKILYRIIALIILALLAGPLFAFTVNMLIALEIMPTDELSSAVGQELASKSVYVWLASLLPAAFSLVMKKEWSKYLLAFPLIAPSLYAVLYSIGL